MHPVRRVLVAALDGAAAGDWTAGAGWNHGLLDGPLLDGHLDGGNRADEHPDAERNCIPSAHLVPRRATPVPEGRWTVPAVECLCLHQQEDYIIIFVL